ncbi:MAG: septal ring lytic transglycosylase RlpA family protein [Aquincola sp.]|nr:septal ring lytic transglycosylase RlpA family protein [Aquincola sp.]MDH4288695.1 septal ring lytic transglycosylase RlpA family protein [Aquincola sp.]MDH5328560.1 septal ring lytic transglycosylase RlpA family protein [Aquincola sp.]
MTVVLRPLAVFALVMLLASCASREPARPLPGLDGPQERPPPDLLQVPDALPQLEPIREGGPNKPYELFGQTYTPLRAEAAYAEKGLASWYGRKFHGRQTSSGERYNMYAMTAAHKTLPIPSYVRVTNPANGRSVIVRVNDRGPFVKGRIIDLSYTAALKLDLLRGVAPVVVERITPEAIRTGEWDAANKPAVVVDNDDGPPDPVPRPPGAAGAGEARASAPPATASRPPAVAGRGFWLQLGAYREHAGALQLQQQAAESVEGLSPLLAVFSDSTLHRVQAGPFATREEAMRAGDRVREQMLLTPLVIERR